MILTKLESTEPLHGYGIARRIEQVIANALRFNQERSIPQLLRPQQRLDHS